MLIEEKTGKKIPQNRMDEIKISLDKLKEMSMKCDGLLDAEFETNWLLRDISVSLSQLVDINIALLSRLNEKDAKPQ